MTPLGPHVQATLERFRLRDYGERFEKACLLEAFFADISERIPPRPPEPNARWYRVIRRWESKHPR